MGITMKYKVPDFLGKLYGAKLGAAVYDFMAYAGINMKLGFNRVDLTCVHSGAALSTQAVILSNTVPYIMTQGGQEATKMQVWDTVRQLAIKSGMYGPMSYGEVPQYLAGWLAANNATPSKSKTEVPSSQYSSGGVMKDKPPLSSAYDGLTAEQIAVGVSQHMPKAVKKAEAAAAIINSILPKLDPTDVPPMAPEPAAKILSPNAAKKMTKCPMREAKSLGQRVNGTSAIAVYRVVAIGAEVSMAVRLADGKLSVRVECDEEYPSALVDELVSMGFKQMGSHYSAHLLLNNLDPARVLGSVLFGVGQFFNQRVISREQFNQAIG